MKPGGEIIMRTHHPSKNTFISIAAFALVAMSGAISYSDSPATWSSNVPAPNSAVATPASVLGWTPGDDYKLDSWDDLTKVYERLAATSDRVIVKHVGKTTLGHDYLVVYISSPENLKKLDYYKDLNFKITDPRRLKHGDKEAEQAIKNGKVFVALTYGIHSTETASYLGGQNVAYKLASSNDPETLRILDNTIIILVPARNPDGVDIVKTSYDKRLAAEQSGQASQGGRGGGAGGLLINKYIGHDDNRDFVGVTQPETKLELKYVYNAWHPQIVHDVHQQGANGPRLTLPPYTAPVEPNIPKEVVKQYHDLGYAIAKDLFDEGFTGVQNGGSEGGEGYDDWSPLRHYVHFHNAVRILEESASVNIASPITLTPDQVRQQPQGPNFLAPWPGGTWHIGDAVKLVQATTFSLLDHAANDREYYLRASYEIAKKAVAPRTAGEKAAFLIPDAPNREALLSTISKGGIEIQYLKSDQEINGAVYKKGTAVVRLDQPYGGYANAILSSQDYPKLVHDDGTPIRPYDVTAHTLPLLFNVPVVTVNAPFEAKLTKLATIPETPIAVTDRASLPGAVRIGLIKANSQDEGWVRFVFDNNGVKFTEIDNAEIQAGHLKDHYDAIVTITGISASEGRGGGRGGAAGRAGREGARTQTAANPQTPDAAPAPPAPANAPNPAAAGGGQGGFGGYGEFGGRGGLNPEGIAAVKDFVESGGTLIALNGASDSVISSFNLPLKDVTQGVNRADYFSPGEILKANVDTSSPIANGFSSTIAIWNQNSPSWDIDKSANTSNIHVVASYPTDQNPLLSGWLLGENTIEGKAALVDVNEGKGHLVLFGFLPHYRSLSLGTFPFLFNAINEGGQTQVAKN